MRTGRPPGPRPLPVNVVRLRGSTDAQAAKHAVPEPEIAIPDAPADISDDGREVWITFARQLAGMRVVTRADFAALQMLCESWVRWKSATRTVTETGFMVRSPNGLPMQNPMLSVANKAQDQCLKILAEFGLTPSSRSRLRPDG